MNWVDLSNSYNDLSGTNKVNQVSYVYGSNRESANQITTHSNYVYDTNGSILSSTNPNKNLLMDYDIRSNLVSSIAINNQNIINYDYDASGERVYSGMGNSSKIYINTITSNPLTIIDSNDNVTHYIYGPKGIVAKRNESLTYYMLKDHLGSTRVVMNENNQAISSYDYDAWGNPMNSTVSEESAYRYTGREYDEETGLHNFRARLYDSTLMRFYQVDPAEQFASPYVYCGNNPISLQDKDGCYAYIEGDGNKQVFKEMKPFFEFKTRFNKDNGQIEPVGNPSQLSELGRVQWDALVNPDVNIIIKITRNTHELSSDGSKQLAIMGFSDGSIIDPNSGSVVATQFANPDYYKALSFHSREKLNLIWGHELIEGYYNATNHPGLSYSHVLSHGLSVYLDSHQRTLQLLNQSDISIPLKWMRFTPITNNGVIDRYRIDPFGNAPFQRIHGRFQYTVDGDLELWKQ